MKSTDNTFSVDKPEESSGFLLWQVTNLWQRKIKKSLEKYELTHSQFVLMASIHWLMLHKQEVTQIILSAHTKIDPMTTSMVLRTLQKKQLITRTEHQTDTRAKAIKLTLGGQKMARQAVKTIEGFDALFFQPLSDKVKAFNKNLLVLLNIER